MGTGADNRSLKRQELRPWLARKHPQQERTDLQWLWFPATQRNAGVTDRLRLWQAIARLAWTKASKPTPACGLA